MAWDAEELRRRLCELESHPSLPWEMIKDAKLVQFLAELPNDPDSIIGCPQTPRHPDATRDNPRREAQLLAIRKKAALRHLTKIPATAVRLFVCGDAYAGKTTLLSTLSCLCLHKSQGSSEHTPQGSSQCVERTRGIEVHALERDGIQVCTWDMAGQAEFHAFHDHMIPDPSNSSAMFMFVWSPSKSKDESDGDVKTEDEFKDSFQYWLRFIAAKSPQSNILRKIIVVFTRQDQMTLVLHALKDSITALKTTFKEIFEVVQVFEVDARSSTSVEPLLSCMFKTAKEVLKDVEIYGICAEVSSCLLAIYQRNGPIMPWHSFTELCAKDFKVFDPEIQKAIAYSLNESGCLIYLSHLPFLVLDPNWFCNVVMGSLIHFPHFPITSKGFIPIRGYASPSYLEAILVMIAQNRVEGHLLMDLLEAMHVFCRVPDDGDGKVFIPATLLDISTSQPALKWRGTSSESFAYAGRRLECDRKDLTFLTPGLFHMIQVLLNKAFLETKAGSVQLGNGFIFICKEDLQIIVEWGLAKREHVIDVMVRASHEGDVKGTVDDVGKYIIKTLARVCAQPIGNQGVVLVESVIRPYCLRTPAPSDVREDQCAFIVDLKQELRRKLEEGRPSERLLHVWEGRHFDAELVYDHFIDLLGVELYEKELQSYKESLQDASMMLQCTSESGDESLMENVELASKPTYGCTMSQGLFETASTSTSAITDRFLEESMATDGTTQKSLHSNRQGEDGPFEVTVTRQLARLISQKMERVKCDVQIIKSSMESMQRKVDVVDGKLDVIDGKLDVMHGKLNVMHRNIMEFRNEVLPKILNSAEQSLNFAIENERGRVPRFVFLTTEGVGFKRRMVTAVMPDVTSVRIELFCEHREGPHRIEGQKGLCVSTVKGGTFLKKALPYVQGFLRVLTMLLKVGAHVVAGLPESSIPDCSKLIALALDTPGFLESEPLLAKLDALCAEDFLGWEEWLVNELTKKKGPNQVHTGIHQLFGLRRTRCKDLKVEWLCDTHASL